MQEAARKAKVDLALLVGLVRIESNFRPDVRSSAGAIGLTQVMPQTGKANGCGNLWDPKENLECGARVLNRFLKFYDGKEVLGLSAYHAGHIYAMKAKKSSMLPQNAEYVERVLEAASKFRYFGCKAFAK